MCWQCSATISMLECQVFSSKYGKPSQDDVFREIINYIAYALYIYIYKYDKPSPIMIVFNIHHFSVLVCAIVTAKHLVLPAPFGGHPRMC